MNANPVFVTTPWLVYYLYHKLNMALIGLGPVALGPGRLHRSPPGIPQKIETIQEGARASGA